MRTHINLGKLEQVHLREIWPNEQYDFSKWLAKEENMLLLNEALGLRLTDIKQEVSVGAYRCDLMAQDEITGFKVIIENQLEATNHDHLGKLITYASGLDASVIIWIVKKAREEHKSAIQWLNHNMAKEISFFLVEIKAYKIGQSLPAPKFKIIEKPIAFNKQQQNLSPAELERLTFWQTFNKVLCEKGQPFNMRKATSSSWYDVALGNKNAHICLTLLAKENRLSIDLYIKNNKALFAHLFSQKKEIEKKLNFPLVWENVANKKVSKIKSSLTGLDFKRIENYPALITDCIERVKQLELVFKDYL